MLFKELVWPCSNFRYLNFCHSVSSVLPLNGTVSPNQTEALTKTQQTQLSSAVQCIWVNGEDKYIFRYFHSGFWESCEIYADGKRALPRENACNKMVGKHRERKKKRLSGERGNMVELVTDYMLNVCHHLSVGAFQNSLHL